MADSPEHITCRELVELVNDYIDSALPPEEGALFEQHLNFCEGCVRYVDQVRVSVASVGRLREGDVDPETRERLLVAFRDWKRS